MVTAKVAVDAAGITYRQFDYWCRRGYLQVNKRNEGAGAGVPRVVPWREVQVARLMGELIAAGVEVETACRVAREIRTTGFGTLGGKFRIRPLPGGS
jgi:hypothetical protein